LSQSEEDLSEIGTTTTPGQLNTGRTMTTMTLGDGTLTSRTNMQTESRNIMSARSPNGGGRVSALASARSLASARVSIAGDFPLLTNRKSNPDPTVTLQLYGKEQPIPEGTRFCEEAPSHHVVVEPEQSFADVIEMVSEMVGFNAIFEYRQEKFQPLVLHGRSVFSVRWYSARGEDRTSESSSGPTVYISTKNSADVKKFPSAYNIEMKMKAVRRCIPCT
jgi:hypothetical protein